jgi:hypothetical protein
MDIESEIVEALKHQIIPLKFCFLGNGANRWDSHRGKGGQHHSAEFGLGKREYTGLMNVLSLVPELKRPTNIMHVGVGNGIELPLIFSAFDFQKHSYIGVDISYDMIKKTIQNQEATLKKIRRISFMVSDVEKEGNLQKICNWAKIKAHGTNLLLFPGEGTLLSNFNVFQYICDALGKNDLVLISLEGDNPSKRREILHMYDLDTSKSLYRVGLERVGITEGQFLYPLFNEKRHRIEVFFETADKKRYLCLSSYKPPSKIHFKETLERHGLTPFFIEYYPDSWMYGSICKKR